MTTVAGGPRVLRALRRPDLPADRWIAAVIDANTAMVDRALQTSALDRSPPGIIHVHDWMAGHAGRLLASAWQVPLVSTIHATERGRHQGHLPPGISPWIDAQERHLVRASARVIVCADHMRDHLTTFLDADPSGVVVIPNGVDMASWAVPRAAGTAMRRRCAPTGHHHIVSAGRLEYEKGVQVLLDATASLAVPSSVRLTVAGDGTYGRVLREQSMRQSSPRVRFLGRVDQPRLARLFSSASVVVVPSLYEPFGLAALEAMASGVPVIASRTGGLIDVIGDAGILVPPGDARALGVAIDGLLSDSGRRRGLVAAGLRRARELSWTATAEQTLRVYREVT